MYMCIIFPDACDTDLHLLHVDLCKILYTDVQNNFSDLAFYSMRGSRKVLQRGSNFDKIFLVDGRGRIQTSL